MTGVTRRSLGCLCIAVALAVIGIPLIASGGDLAAPIGGLLVGGAILIAVVSLASLALDLLRPAAPPRRGAKAKQIGRRVTIGAVVASVILGLSGSLLDDAAGGVADWLNVLAGYAMLAALIGAAVLTWGLIHAEPMEATEPTVNSA